MELEKDGVGMRFKCEIPTELMQDELRLSHTAMDAMIGK